MQKISNSKETSSPKIIDTNNFFQVRNEERQQLLKVITSENKKVIVSANSNSFTPVKIVAARFNSIDNLIRKVCSVDGSCRMVVQQEKDEPVSRTTKTHRLKIKPVEESRSEVKFIDLLDDLSCKDLLPLKSEYPRKDNQRELEYKQIQDTYLFKLMYGAQATKTAWDQLLEPTIKYTRTGRPHWARPIKSHTEPLVSDSIMAKLYSSYDSSKRDILKRLSPYIYDPKQASETRNTVIVMPMRVFQNDSTTNKPKKSTNKSSLNKKAVTVVSRKGSRSSKKSQRPKKNTKPKIGQASAGLKVIGTPISGTCKPWPSCALLTIAGPSTKKCPVKKVIKK